MKRKEKDMRLAAQAKMGYYPSPASVTQIILRHLKPHREGRIRVFDPCAGEGSAIKLIGDHLHAETYGIEIDRNRGGKAKEILTRCLVTDYRSARISRRSFSLLYLNPPYDWAARECDIERSERYERTFLRDCIANLFPGGVLVYLIPQGRLDHHIARMLSYRFEQLGIFRFPEDQYKAFKQLVIFGMLKRKPGKDDRTEDYLKKCGKFIAVVPYLPGVPSRIYRVPVSPVNTAFFFRSKDIDSEQLAGEIQKYGLFEKIEELTTPLSMAERIRPIMPLRQGHLAQVLASGFMNGVVWDRDKKNPLLVKGITEKKVKHTVEMQGEIEKHRETDEIKIVIHAFDRQGKMMAIR